jgi:polar amino acid transport system substrate-binding protein
MKRNIRRRGLAAAVGVLVTVVALAGCSSTGSTTTAASSSGDSNKLGLVTPGVLRVVTVGGQKPYVYQDASGNWIGFEPDLVADVAKRVGINKVEFVEQDFSTLLAAVANRKYDIAAACIGVTAERQKTIDYTSSYNNGYLTFVAKPSAGITSESNLAGKRVGVVTGSVEDTYMKEKVPSASIVGFPDSNAAVQALLSGAVDTAFIDEGTAGNYVKQYPQLAIAVKVESTAPCAWPISKDDTALKTALNTGIAAAIADGTVERLTKQWLPGTPILPEYKPKS